MVLLKDVNVYYGKVHTLKDINFTFRNGVIYGILGPNGAGKTTLLRTIAGILRYSGSIKVDGKELREIHFKERVRYLGYLPQRESIPYGFTLIDMIMMGGYMVDGDRVSMFERAVELLDRLGMGELYRRRVERLSNGEVSIGRFVRLFIQDPEYILIDEAVSGLDYYHRVEILKILKEFVTRGRTVLMVSHDLNFIVQYVDHVILLKKGRIYTHGRNSFRVINRKNLKDVYGIDVAVVRDSKSGKILISYPEL